MIINPAEIPTTVLLQYLFFLNPDTSCHIFFQQKYIPLSRGMMVSLVVEQ
jgi:hypothetical protein